MTQGCIKHLPPGCGTDHLQEQSISHNLNATLLTVQPEIVFVLREGGQPFHTYFVFLSYFQFEVTTSTRWLKKSQQGSSNRTIVRLKIIQP